MGLFTKRDRIAIACIALLIVLGWTVRLTVMKKESPGDIRIIRSAVSIPPSLTLSDSLTVTRININTASERELEMLPSIGAMKAKAIILYRLQNGLFSRPNDIMKVPGIGEKIYERIKDYIAVTSQKTAN